MPRKSSYTKRDSVRKPIKAGDYSSVTVTQVTETSTATGQKVPTQVVSVAQTEKDPGKNKTPKSSYGTNTSYGTL